MTAAPAAMTPAPAATTVAPAVTPPSADTSMAPTVVGSLPPPQSTSPDASMVPTSVSPGGNCSGLLSREEELLNQLGAVTDMMLLLDMNTAQGQAYDWLVNEDPAQIDPCTYPTVGQRYALATLYYGSGGTGWNNSAAWLSELDECFWVGVECSPMGWVTGVILRKSFCDI